MTTVRNGVVPRSEGKKAALAGALFAGVGLILTVAALVAAMRPQLGAVELVDLSLDRWPGENEPSLTALVKNPLGGTVNDLQFSLVVDGIEFRLPDTEDASAKGGAMLGPKSEQRIRIAPVSAFLAALARKCQGCTYLGSSLVQEMPRKLRSEHCREFVERGQSCRLEYGLYPVVLTKRFSTGRIRSVEERQTFYVYLSRTAKGRYVVPKS